MILEVRLGEADRERLGAPDVLPIDPGSVTAREAIILQRGVDLGDGMVVQFASPGDWRRKLVEKDPDGRPLIDWAAELVLIWLALRRSGIDVPLAELDYLPDATGYRPRIEDEPAVPGAESDGEPGKADAPSSIPETTSSDGSGDTSPA